MFTSKDLPILMSSINDEVLGLSKRTLQCLTNDGLTLVVNVLNKTRHELLRIPNLGPSCVNEIEETLKALGDYRIGMLSGYSQLENFKGNIEEKLKELGLLKEAPAPLLSYQDLDSILPESMKRGLTAEFMRGVLNEPTVIEGIRSVLVTAIKQKLKLP